MRGKLKKTLSGFVMRSSGGGGKPCIQPMTFGSLSSAVGNPVACAFASDVMADSPITPQAAIAASLEIEDDIHESSYPVRVVPWKNVSNSVTRHGDADAGREEDIAAYDALILDEEIVREMGVGDAGHDVARRTADVETRGLPNWSGLFSSLARTCA
jgi:hypothetical protein